MDSITSLLIWLFVCLFDLAEFARTSFNHTTPHLSPSSHRDFALNDELRNGSRQLTAPDILNNERQISRLVLTVRVFYATKVSTMRVGYKQFPCNILQRHFRQHRSECQNRKHWCKLQQKLLCKDRHTPNAIRQRGAIFHFSKANKSVDNRKL